MIRIKTRWLFLLGLLLLMGCMRIPTYNDPIPKYQTLKIQSQEVGEERTINIWTPADYNNGADFLPVLYMLDGGIKEDFSHIANTLTELIETKKIPPIILIGIENTTRRKDLTGPTMVEKDKEIAPVVGGSKAFRAFIAQELIPEIGKKYSVTQQKGIIGESLAGLFVTETFLCQPDLFDFYIAFDPSLWWNDKHLVKKASDYLDHFPTTKKTFWFAGSAAKDIYETVAKLSDALEAKKIANLNWKHSPEPKEKHHTIFRATKEKALIWALSH